jgi:hypothetical protein
MYLQYNPEFLMYIIITACSKVNKHMHNLNDIKWKTCERWFQQDVYHQQQKSAAQATVILLIIIVFIINDNLSN